MFLKRKSKKPGLTDVILPSSWSLVLKLSLEVGDRVALSGILLVVTDAMAVPEFVD